MDKSAVKANPILATQIFALRDAPYAQLFKGATSVGLLVHSWESWVEEQRENLETFAANGGTFTLVILNPDHEQVVAMSASRWLLRRKDPKSKIRNTIALIQDIFKAKQLRLIKRDTAIWYCVIRFAYDDPSEVVFVVSPYSHSDTVVAEIPAVLVRRSERPEIAAFFEQDWLAVSQSKAP